MMCSFTESEPLASLIDIGSSVKASSLSKFSSETFSFKVNKQVSKYLLLFDKTGVSPIDDTPVSVVDVLLLIPFTWHKVDFLISPYASPPKSEAALFCVVGLQGFKRLWEGQLDDCQHPRSLVFNHVVASSVDDGRFGVKVQVAFVLKVHFINFIFISGLS